MVQTTPESFRQEIANGVAGLLDNVQSLVEEVQEPTQEKRPFLRWMEEDAMDNLQVQKSATHNAVPVDIPLLSL